MGREKQRCECPAEVSDCHELTSGYWRKCVQAKGKEKRERWGKKQQEADKQLGAISDNMTRGEDEKDMQERRAKVRKKRIRRVAEIKRDKTHLPEPSSIPLCPYHPFGYDNVDLRHWQFHVFDAAVDQRDGVLKAVLADNRARLVDNVRVVNANHLVQCKKTV